MNFLKNFQKIRGGSPKPAKTLYFWSMKVGILAIQGDVEEHKLILSRLGVETVRVKLPMELEGTDALIIPGGESTTFRRILLKTGLFDAIKEYDRPILGTCAGIIIMASNITNEEDNPHVLKKLNISIERNAYGRQRESFEAHVRYTFDGERNVAFIRAPRIVRIGEEVEVIAKLGDEVVGVRQGRNVGLTFHPEITGDTTAHEYFLRIVQEHA